MAEGYRSFEEVKQSGLIKEILTKIISNNGKSKKYTDVLPLDGGTVGIAHFAVGGLAELYREMDTQKYFGKSVQEMIANYSKDCRPSGRKGNDTGWGCYSKAFWRTGMQNFVNSNSSQSIQDKAWTIKMQSTISVAIQRGWNTSREIAIALGISNSLGEGGFKNLAQKNGWDAEKTLRAYASTAHRKRRENLINQNFPSVSKNISFSSVSKNISTNENPSTSNEVIEIDENFSAANESNLINENFPEDDSIPSSNTTSIPTPQEVEDTRKKEASQIQDDKSKIINSDAQIIEKATPDSLKPKGSAKLSTLIRNIGKKIVTSLIPIAIDLVKQLVTKIVEDEIAKAKEKANKEQQEIQKNIDELEAKVRNGVGELTVQIGALKTKKASIPIVVQTLENNLRAQLTNLGSFSFNDLVTNIPNILKEVFNDGCPNPNSPILKEIISKRNALVNLLNKLGTQLDRLTQAITGLNTYVDISQTAITAILTAKKVSSTAIKLVPSPPGTPGIITSLLSDLGDIINKLLFEKDGKPRLPKVSSAIASAALAISIVNGYIKQIVSILNALDFKLKQCAPDLAGDNVFPGLTPISSDLISIAELQTKAEQTQNDVTYAGFVIEIEEVPYTPTVNRRRAVGKNQSGIKLVQTELSFTTQDEILINELKLIIDRDNLKAY